MEVWCIGLVFELGFLCVKACSLLDITVCHFMLEKNNPYIRVTKVSLEKLLKLQHDYLYKNLLCYTFTKHHLLDHKLHSVIKEEAQFRPNQNNN